MEAKIVCYFGDRNGEPVTRTFIVNDPELAKLQICYFDRFIPAFVGVIKGLEESFTFATLQNIYVVVSCHGYNHTYRYRNGNIEKKG